METIRKKLRLPFSLAARLTLLLAIGASGAPGCAPLRIPAIDPTGERIFLPAPASTTLVGPDLSECFEELAEKHRDPGVGVRTPLPPPAIPGSWPTLGDCASCIPGFPKPAFSAPREPPRCDQEGNPPPGSPDDSCHPIRPAAKGPPGRTIHDGPKAGVKYGRLILSPARVVAPVGSEVVVTAGLCDPDGFYVVKEPLEFILSQESVGNLVDVGEPGYGLAPLMFNRGSKKLSSNYAVGLTASKTATFTRGTIQTNDDFTVRRGQSWVSVTSPSEGLSHITVWAPNAQAWDLRRQTATIHWVDAQWRLPGPAIVSAGESHTLRTRVTRTSGAVARGWEVRYEILDGPPAAFGPNGETIIDVPVDSRGDASVELIPQGASPGTTRIAIQIVRPGEQSGEPERMVIGQGTTTVTWSAADLAVRVQGPANAGLDEVITYRVEVHNPGDLPARNVVMRDVAPPTLEYLNSSPSGQPMGDFVQWSLGNLGPRETRLVEVNRRARQNGDVRYCFRVRADGDLEAESCARTRVFTSTLSVQMVGPETAEVGETVTYRIEIQNTGSSPLTNVALTDRFDSGLRHTEGQSSPIERLVGTLQPGERVRDLAVSFVVTAPGRHCHTLVVSADGGHRSSVQRCVVGRTPEQPARLPRLEVRKSGPEQLREGESGIFLTEIRNTGEAPATNLRIVDRYDNALRPTNATEGGVPTEAGQAVAWTLRELQPGETTVREVECLAVAPNAQATSQVTVSTEQGVRGQAETETAIEGRPAPPADEPDRPSLNGPLTPDRPDRPATGELRVTAVALDNPVAWNQPIRILINVINDRDVSDRNITVTALIPENVNIDRVAGTTVRHRIVGREVRWDPIAELRPREGLRPPMEIELLPTQAGRVTIRVRVESVRTSEPIEVIREVDVLPQ
jgi:uncharacterized repeat protein (TIGR01451 family)